MRLKTLLGIAITVVIVAPAMAQAPVTGVADPESLFTSPDPKLHANKQVVREYPDPRDSRKTYTTTWFDMWRIRDGKADEHWDPATIAAPSAAPAGR